MRSSSPKIILDLIIFKLLKTDLHAPAEIATRGSPADHQQVKIPTTTTTTTTNTNE
jgi:hypothetical protein